MQIRTCPCGKSVVSLRGRPRLRCDDCRGPLTPERRSERARIGAQARWGPPRSPWKRPEGYVSPSRRGTCSRCGKTIQVTRSSAPPERRRCQECRRADPAPYGPRKVPEQRICVLCGELYTLKKAARPDQRWCSKSCAQAWRNGARPPYVRVQDERGDTRASRQRRRRLARIQTWDGVSDEAILERDRWRCGICRKRIGKTFRYPHPRSKSIDHIIPLSEGGDDTAANKRAAHLACNCGRMNRGGGEQLAMIG